MKLVATLVIPAKDAEYIRNVWEQGNYSSLIEYITNGGGFEKVELQ